MFHHAAATSKHKHDCAICWGRWKPPAEWSMEGELTAMKLIQPDSSWEDTADLYHNVYQLWRLPGRMFCDEETEACICQEILDSVKECLWCKQLSALLGEEPGQSPPNVPRLNPQAEFNTRNYATYDSFMDVKQISCEVALAIARDAHQWSWWPRHCWRIKLRGWAIPSATVADALEVADAQAATSEGDPRLWIIEPKSPRWCHAIGTLLQGEPSHPALPNQDSG